MCVDMKVQACLNGAHDGQLVHKGLHDEAHPAIDDQLLCAHLLMCNVKRWSAQSCYAGCYSIAFALWLAISHRLDRPKASSCIACGEL